MNKKELAAKLLTYYKYENNKVICTDDEATKNLAYQVHSELFDAWPDDWIYNAIYDVLESYEEYGSIEDFLCDVPLCFNDRDLLEWAKSSYALSSIEEARGEGLICPTCSLIDQIQMGQYQAMSEIAYFIDHFLEENCYMFEKEKDEATTLGMIVRIWFEVDGKMILKEMSVQQILEEVNRNRNAEWINYDYTDWQDALPWLENYSSIAEH